MITCDGLIAFRPVLFVMLGLLSFPASAQDGVPFQLREVQERLGGIEAGVKGVETTVNEIALVDRSRCDRPVSWNRKLPGNERFVQALNGHAYCDLETGLVWMETPLDKAMYWQEANERCRLLEIDGRRGWHLPTIEQLQTLIDLRNSYPALPDDHPFKGVRPEPYFTSSPDEDSIYGQYREVWLVDLARGWPFTRDALDPPFTIVQAKAWCVRGGASPLPISDVNLEGDEVDYDPN
jgi:hypothetical protein